MPRPKSTKSNMHFTYESALLPVPRLGAAIRNAVWCVPALLLALGALSATAADRPVRPDQPNAITFPAQAAKFVRFVIMASSSGQPCIDELEVYGSDARRNLGLEKHGGKATASSCLPGYAFHQIAHLNDGLYGNEHSWIAAGASDEWVQIELPKPVQVCKVVFSRDRKGQYADRVPVGFEVRLSADGQQWTTVSKVTGTAVATTRAAAIVPGPPPPPTVQADPVARSRTGDLNAPRTDALGFANLALAPQAKAHASSLIPGFRGRHEIAHLNDGRYGNGKSWISRTDPSWAEVDLGQAHWVYKVAFGSDNSGSYSDRAATGFCIQAAADRDQWRTAVRQISAKPVHLRREFKFRPVRARWVRIAIATAQNGCCRIDEIEVYGQQGPISLDRIGPVPALPVDSPAHDQGKLLRSAFLGEEHAWLKTYGRADMDARLTEYRRVKQYPRHVGDDCLPLPALGSAPRIDGRLDDACWREATRGVVRVARPDDLDEGPLVIHEVWAGRLGRDLVLAIRTQRLLSSHIAVVSSADMQGCGVVAYTAKGFVFNTYSRTGPRGEQAKLEASKPVDAAFDPGFKCCELRLPLDMFPDCESTGVRLGLGMGGKHTSPLGRPVHFVCSSLTIAEQPPCVGGVFRVGLAVPAAGAEVAVRGNAPGLERGLTLAPGRSQTIAIPAKQGPIGPEYDLAVHEGEREPYVLHLFRYDALERTLCLMEGLANRLAAKGLDVRQERHQIETFRKRQEQLLALVEPDLAVERQAFVDARLAKRRLFMREPDLAPLSSLLFVKRRPFEPSHNYSDYFDARFRPGGGVYLLTIPQQGDRLAPDRATETRLFDAGPGIARNPAANFDLSKVYFGYRPSEDGYYHIMAVNPDGSGPKQLTYGPFHDFWPCPLPDGGIAAISTRCTCRALCWRPQVSVLFRMDADGSNIRPLSLANLTEWAPSVMNDGRIIWTRWEYLDKGADFGHTLWSIRPDGTYPELVFGNTIIQPNGYANGREVPGTHEICCTLISHFGDLNGPIALLDIVKGRFNPEAIASLTPEVPWPGSWPREECFRDPVPVARDYFLCSHAPRRRFGIYVIDRFGNRELVHADPAISIMCPTVYRARKAPPVIAAAPRPDSARGEFVLTDVYEGLEPTVKRGAVRYVRVVEEVRSELQQLPNGEYRKDHRDFTDWYATPVHKVSGPHGWPAYVAKAPWGLVPVEEDGSAHFFAPAGKTLYLQALDKDFNELQRMRSVVHLQPGETRSCIGCHESRRMAPPAGRRPMARGPRELQAAAWGAKPFSFERVVQPVLDAKCVRCHDSKHKMKLNLTAALDVHKVPASYRTLISRGLVHYVDCRYNAGGCEKREPLTFGTVKSKLWAVLNAGHHDVKLTTDEVRRTKTWIDLNCPLWPDYTHRPERPGTSKSLAGGRR